jgi:carotenoid cleavage dioxygenase-like enzyme
MAAALDPSNSTADALSMIGTLPAALSGRLLGIGSDVVNGTGVVHSVELHGGRITGHRSRLIDTDAAAPDVVARNIIGFGGSILALAKGSLAEELTADLATLRRVDLAGRSRRLAAVPKLDRATGELHLVAAGSSAPQVYVVVSAGSLTRRIWPLLGAPNRVTDLAISGDHVVFVTHGFLGVGARDGETTRWIATGADAPALVHAYDAGDGVVVLAVTPSLERWTVHAGSGAVHREVLDPRPRRSALVGPAHGERPQFVWTCGGDTVVKHELDGATSTTHVFESGCDASHLVFVADPARASTADGGWLVGFVHQASGDETDLVVLDAADIAGPAVATVRMPRLDAGGLHSTWIASS